MPETSDEREGPRYPGTPGWVKGLAAAVVVIAVLLLLVLALGTALGLHTPGGHG